MAKTVDKAQQEDPNWLERWSSMLRDFGTIHNEVFAHAVSDFSIIFALQPIGAFAPAVGPTYIPELVEIAINHMVPLYLLMLVDASMLISSEMRRKVSPEARRVLDRGRAWAEAHPAAKFGDPDDVSDSLPI